MITKDLEDLIKKYRLTAEDADLVEKAAQILASQQKKTTKKKAYSIRLNVDDMEKIRIYAKEEWLPYQTLIGSLIHKYVEWRE